MSFTIFDGRRREGVRNCERRRKTMSVFSGFFSFFPTSWDLLLWLIWRQGVSSSLEKCIYSSVFMLGKEVWVWGWGGSKKVQELAWFTAPLWWWTMCVPSINLTVLAHWTPLMVYEVNQQWARVLLFPCVALHVDMYLYSWNHSNCCLCISGNPNSIPMPQNSLGSSLMLWAAGPWQA